MRAYFVCLFCAISIMVNAQSTLDLATLSSCNGQLETAPTREIENVDDGVVVSYNFHNIALWPDDLFDGNSFVRIDGFGVNTALGEPAILRRKDAFVVPRGCVVGKVDIIDSAFVDIPLQLSPSRPLLVSDGSTAFSKENVPGVTAYDGLFPQKLIVDSKSESYRDVGMLSVVITPMQYDYSHKTLRMYTKLKYKVTFTSSGKKKASAPSVVLSDEEEGFLANILLNWQHTAQGSQPKKEVQSVSGYNSLTSDGYLILSVTPFSSAINKLLGFTVYTDIRDSWNSFTDLHMAVWNCYKSHPNLKYILVIGDEYDIPGQMRDNYYSDYLLGCDISGSNSIPYVMRGRIPVTSLSNANTIIDKIIEYERNPVLDEEFYSKALHCAYFQDEEEQNQNIGVDSIEYLRCAETSEDILNYVRSKGKTVNRIYNCFPLSTPKYWGNGIYSKGGLISEELRSPDFKWNLYQSKTQISNYINEGVFYALYSGHGTSTGWSDPTYSALDAILLTNGKKLPVVFSFACSTGAYNEGPSFVEQFLLNPNGGCVAMFAATGKTNAGVQDALAEGMFDAIWPNPGLRPQFRYTASSQLTTPTPTYRLGQILDQGLVRMDETWTGSAYNEEMKHKFQCFGDPSMMMYTEKPTEFPEGCVVRDADNITVSLTEKATISFYNSRTHETGCYTGAYIKYPNDEDIIVVVSGHNKIPFIDKVEPFCIQNETISTSKSYNSTYIKIGNQVTDAKQHGDVIFQSGNTQIKGRRVELHPGTKILVGSSMEISN